MFSILLKKFNNWKHNRLMSNYGIRPAVPEDLDYILEYIIKDARDGYYLNYIPEQDRPAQCKLLIQALIHKNKIFIAGDKGIEQRNGHLLIYGNNCEGLIGYAVIFERYEGSHDTDVEIMMFGIKPEYRKMGHGLNMLECILSGCPTNYKIFARCYAKSEIMGQLLAKAGFEVLNTKESGTREYEFNKI